MRTILAGQASDVMPSLALIATSGMRDSINWSIPFFAAKWKDALVADSLDAVKRYWSALRSRDARQILESVTEDVEWLAPRDNATAVALGVTNHMIGAQAVIRFILEDFPRLFSNGLSIDLISATETGDTVVFEQRQRASLVNGRNLDLNYVFVFEIANGKVRRIREYMDTHGQHRMVFGDQAARKII